MEAEIATLEHELDALAHQFLAEGLSRRAEEIALRAEYVYPERAWQHTYPSYSVFRARYESRVHRILDRQLAIDLDLSCRETRLAAPPTGELQFEPPTADSLTDLDEWEQCLRRSINGFYRCSAVESVRMARRGHYAHEWHVDLHPGNDPGWLRDHLSTLLGRIRAVQHDGGWSAAEAIRVRAPCYPYEEALLR